MAGVEERPFPAGDYDLVIVGSGPGALQLSYSLTRLGVRHAVLSQDEAPGGMFRKWPVFQRLLSWTKPYAPQQRGTRAYERYDWNSLLADDGPARCVMPALMDGSSYFPSRPEMERSLATFAERAGVHVRYGCRWESTSRDGDRFVLGTTDGGYRTRVAVFAVGVAEPWRPPIPGLELAAHYGEQTSAESYADKRVFIVGKQNSGFELASGLLSWARQIIIASPSPTKLSVNTRTLVGVRARYVQPWEDYVLAGGVIILSAAIEEVTRLADGFRVKTRSSDKGIEKDFEVDSVIAATGFIAPLRDLSELGVATFGQSRLPAQTPFWESATVPGIYFAGTLSQGAAGLKKYGIPSNSGAVQGHRYNARVLAHHLASRHFGVAPQRSTLRAEDLASFLLAEATRAPELWHQRSYLARVVSLSGEVVDEGIAPLTHFVDAGGPDAVAVTVESNPAGDLYPAVYTRRAGAISEHLLEPDPLYEFESPSHHVALAAALEGLLPEPVRAGTAKTR